MSEKTRPECTCEAELWQGSHAGFCALWDNPEAGKGCDCTVFVPLPLMVAVIKSLEAHGQSGHYWQMPFDRDLSDALRKLLPK